jgi:hypothetical protein
MSVRGSRKGSALGGRPLSNYAKSSDRRDEQDQVVELDASLLACISKAHLQSIVDIVLLPNSFSLCATDRHK